MSALFLGAIAAQMVAQTPDGKVLFATHCNACHGETPAPRAPASDVLRQRSPDAILAALTSGAMRTQGAQLSGPERRAVAEYLTGRKLGGDVTGAEIGRCTANPPIGDLSKSPSWNGWSPDLANTRFQTAAEAGLSAAQVPKLVLKWAFGFPDATSAWASPTMASGRVFVGSHNGTVYSLDAKTGCIYWAFSAKGGVRTATVVGPNAVYFAATNGIAYAVDIQTGREIWSRKIEDHPLARITGSPALYQNRLYLGVASFEETQGANPDYQCCTFRGSLSSIDATTGEVVWKTYLVPEPKPRGKSPSGATLYGPAGAGIWSAPTIDVKRGLIYAGTGNTYSEPQLPTSDAVVAFDLKTGQIKWTRQATPKDVFITGCRPGSNNPNCAQEVGPDFDFGNSPILAKLHSGREVIVIGQKSGIGYALDPDKAGAILWTYRAGKGSALGGIEWGSAVDGENAYFPVSDILLPQPGGLHAVNLLTGERAWYAPPPPLKCAPGRGCNAAQTAAISMIPGVVFSGSNDGGLRAYSTKDGAIMWEYDTNREFKTLNGVPARGASMHGPGPTIAGGMLYVNSGYGDHGGRAGNVLLAFGLE